MNLNRHVPLRRRMPLVARKYAAKDPVTPQMHAEVIERDLRVAGGCVAAHLDATAGLCRDQWGHPVAPFARAALTLDHVREQPAMALRAPSDRRHLVAICWGHHLHSSWATAHRPELRRYLAEVER